MTTDIPGAAARGDAPRTSGIAASRDEPRAARTQRNLLATIRQVTDEGGLGALTVSELCRRSNIQRMTFYRHWADLDSAVVTAFAALVDSLAVVTDAHVNEASTAEALAQLYASALLDQLRELDDRRAVYRELFSSGRYPAFREAVQTGLRARALLAITSLVRLQKHPVEIDTNAAATYLAGGITSCFVAFVTEPAPSITVAARGMLDQLPAWWPPTR